MPTTMRKKSIWSSKDFMRCFFYLWTSYQIGKNQVRGSHEIRLGHSQVPKKQTWWNKQAGWNNFHSGSSQTYGAELKKYAYIRIKIRFKKSFGLIVKVRWKLDIED